MKEIDLDKDGFEELKQKLETESKTPFVIRTSGDQYTEFICGLSQVRKSTIEKHELLVEPKLSRTKEEYTCPSFLKLNIKNGIYQVKYIDFHAHEILSHFNNIDQDTKNRIEQKLRMGIGENEVLAQIRNEFPEHLITIKEIQNVKQMRNIGSVSFDQNDRLSCSNHTWKLF